MESELNVLVGMFSLYINQAATGLGGRIPQE